MDVRNVLDSSAHLRLALCKCPDPQHLPHRKSFMVQNVLSSKSDLARHAHSSAFALL